MRGPQANGVALGAAGISAATLLCAADTAWAAQGQGFYTGDLGQAVAAIAVFVVLLLILRKWAWGPIIGQLREREDDIVQSVRRAEAREQKAQQLLDDYASRLDKAGQDADKVLATAKQQGEQLREEILAAARKEAQASARQARGDIARARDEALKEMQQTTADMAMDIAKQIIRKGLDPAQQRRLLQESIQDVRRRASEAS